MSAQSPDEKEQQKPRYENTDVLTEVLHSFLKAIRSSPNNPIAASRIPVRMQRPPAIPIVAPWRSMMEKKCPARSPTNKVTPLKANRLPMPAKKCIGRFLYRVKNRTVSKSKKPLGIRLSPYLDLPNRRLWCFTFTSPTEKPAACAKIGIYRCKSP